jgi:thiamine-phosphate pyrophosphorylase
MSVHMPRIYPITDQNLTGLSHSEQVERLADGGATLIQLRDKTSTSREFFREADRALTIARKRGIRIVINDRVDLALSLSADGVHLGQGDLPPEAARRLLGPKAIIGFSTHNLDQVKKAISQPVDYVALGPIFPTTSKGDSEPVVGLSGLAKVRPLIKVPLVAIGGITLDTAESVFHAGADSLALIGALLSEPAAIAERLTSFLRRVSDPRS